jgi:hypothetical protein
MATAQMLSFGEKNEGRSSFGIEPTHVTAELAMFQNSPKTNNLLCLRFPASIISFRLTKHNGQKVW